MIAALGCNCDNRRFTLGQDDGSEPIDVPVLDDSGDNGTDLSSIDFGTGSPTPIFYGPEAPAQGILDIENNPLPITLPANDLGPATTSLAPGTFLAEINGSAVYQTASGQIVDLNGNSVDPSTGISYAQEMSGMGGGAASVTPASALPSGATGLINSLAQALGLEPPQTTTPVTSTTPTTAPTAAPSSLSTQLNQAAAEAEQFVAQYWPYLLGGGVVLVLLSGSKKSRRRK